VASTKDWAYATLKREIESSILAGGMALPERSLAERFGLSRTPVREILSRLSHDGFVELVPHRGAFVRRLTAQDIVDTFYAREAVEGMAARLAAQRHRADRLRPVEQALGRVRIDDKPDELACMVQAGRMLHDFVMEASENRPLQQAYRTLSVLTTVIRSITQGEAVMKSPSPHIYRIEQASYRDHLKILRAVKARQEAAAEDAMRHHLNVTRRRFLGLMSFR
jgi:DNA-binding GntR family transcriptional regulator